ncbi:uncharacterized protein LOC132646259 [Meriones unguiculatus]|uniref:uncharacterized protein LOC132646259 n=1 Tax=Meriones unguiculatus TaxID=10047 RepID=UPI00293EF6B4|nr:uncharacterized protein LOC132646259 [Meriones unguiculatus]
MSGRGKNPPASGLEQQPQRDLKQGELHSQELSEGPTIDVGVIQPEKASGTEEDQQKDPQVVDLDHYTRKQLLQTQSELEKLMRPPLYTLTSQIWETRSDPGCSMGFHKDSRSSSEFESELSLSEMKERWRLVSDIRTFKKASWEGRDGESWSLLKTLKKYFGRKSKKAGSRSKGPPLYTLTSQILKTRSDPGCSMGFHKDSRSSSEFESELSLSEIKEHWRLISDIRTFKKASWEGRDGESWSLLKTLKKYFGRKSKKAGSRSKGKQED